METVSLNHLEYTYIQLPWYHKDTNEPALWLYANGTKSIAHQGNGYMGNEIISCR